MTTSVSFQLGAAAFVVLTLPVTTPGVSRCAGQETGRGVDMPGVFQAADAAQRAADQRATARVLATEVRAALLLLREPDNAYDLLKIVLDAIRNDPDLSEPGRRRLHSHLEWSLWLVAKCRSFIK